VGSYERPAKGAPDDWEHRLPLLPVHSFVPGSENKDVTGFIPIDRYGGVQWNTVKENAQAHPASLYGNSRNGSDDKQPPNVLLYERNIKEIPGYLGARISSLGVTANRYIKVPTLPVNQLRDPPILGCTQGIFLLDGV
jgi:hypothetical protein